MGHPIISFIFSLLVTVFITCDGVFSLANEESEIEDDGIRSIDRAKHNSKVIAEYLELNHPNTTIQQLSTRRRLRHFECPPAGGKYCPIYAFDCSVVPYTSVLDSTFNKGKGCLLCPIGYYVPPKNTNTSESDGKETYVDECLPCAQGQYQGQSGRTSCQQCPIGTYQDQIGSPSCINCALGSLALEVGLIFCKSCKGGSYSMKEAQTICSTGSCSSNQLLLEGPVGRGLSGSQWYCVDDPPKCKGLGNERLNISSPHPELDASPTTMGFDTYMNNGTNSTNSTTNSASSNFARRLSTLDSRCRCDDGLMGDCARGGTSFFSFF